MFLDLKQSCVLVVLFLASACAQSRQEWMQQGQQRIKDAIKLRPNVGVAKNVIFFLGDGMGVSTITAARILKGQLEGQTGEEYRLNMEKLPYTGLIKTYNTNQQTPDSAGTATAFLSGVKTRAGVLGVDERVEQGNCTHLEDAALETVIDWAFAEGKSVGLVSTARITHATPGAAYAKIPHRDWETDVDIKDDVNCDRSKLKDITRQLVEDNHRIQVLLGGGRRGFIPNNMSDPANATVRGRRNDGKDLIQVWQDKQKAENRKYKYVWNNDEFKNVDAKDVDYLLGLFSYNHLDYEIDRQKTGNFSQPSIAEMTKKAIEVLRKNDKGFFLLVEGGRVDHGHHDGHAQRALTDAIAMDDAVKTAQDLTSEVDTLIMVTADHSHVFAIAGYPPRGTPILGFIPMPEVPSYRPTDGYPMTVAVYGNGPGPQRTNLTGQNTMDKEFKFPNAVPLSYETHGGEDVAVFAEGPMSHLVGGLYEQNVLAHIMGYAACMGPDKSHCTNPEAAEFCKEPNSAMTVRVSVVLLVMMSVIGTLLR